MVNDLPKAEATVGPLGLHLLQAPLWRARVAGLPPVHTYTDLLLRSGFVQPTGLQGLARAWRDSVRLLRPDLLVLDHSPVALFATRALGMPRLRFGDGYSCPPLACPMPPMTGPVSALRRTRPCRRRWRPWARDCQNRTDRSKYSVRRLFEAVRRQLPFSPKLDSNPSDLRSDGASMPCDICHRRG